MALILSGTFTGLQSTGVLRSTKNPVFTGLRVFAAESCLRKFLFQFA